MGYSLRVFFVTDDDKLIRIPLKKYWTFFLGHDRSVKFPEYAGQRVRCISVSVENENKKPIDIVRVDYHYMQFDNEGRHNKDESFKGVRLAMDSTPHLPEDKDNGNLIDLTKMFSAKKFRNLYKWKPTKEIEKSIYKAIFKVKKSPLRLV